MGRVFGPTRAAGPGFAVSELFGSPAPRRTRGRSAASAPRQRRRYGNRGVGAPLRRRRHTAGDEFWVTPRPDAYRTTTSSRDRGNSTGVREWEGQPRVRSMGLDRCGARPGCRDRTERRGRARRAARERGLVKYGTQRPGQGEIVRVCAAGRPCAATASHRRLRGVATERHGSAPGVSPTASRAVRDGIVDAARRATTATLRGAKAHRGARSRSRGVGDGGGSQVCGEEWRPGRRTGPCPTAVAPTAPSRAATACSTPTKRATMAGRCLRGLRRVSATSKRSLRTSANRADRRPHSAELASLRMGATSSSRLRTRQGLGPCSTGRAAGCHAVPTFSWRERQNGRDRRGSGCAFDSPRVGRDHVQLVNALRLRVQSLGEVVPAGATVVEERTRAPLRRGLIEAIRISASGWSGEEAAALSGRFNVIVRESIGRFGWKGRSRHHDFAPRPTTTSGHHVAVLADAADLTASCTDVCGPRGRLRGRRRTDPVSQAFADFMTPLAPLTPAAVARGDVAVAATVGAPRATSATRQYARADFTIVALRTRRLPLSRICCARHGPGLADGISRNPHRQRVPHSRYGASLQAHVPPRVRAATLPEAVFAHGGEAQTSANVYFTYSAEQIALLVAYLNSL